LTPHQVPKTPNPPKKIHSSLPPKSIHLTPPARPREEIEDEGQCCGDEVQKKTQQEGDQEGKTNIGERERERDLIDRKVHHRRKPHIDVQDTCSPKPADEYARHVKEAAAEITKAYPDWARSTGGALEPWGQSGEWSYSRGPPYVKKLTLWKGAGVDQVKEGTLWRRVLGLNTAAGRKCDLRSCDHAMTGNSYLTSFDGLVVFSPARITLCSLLL